MKRKSRDERPYRFYIIQEAGTRIIRWGISKNTRARWEGIASSNSQEILRVMEVFGENMEDLEQRFADFATQQSGYNGGSFFQMTSSIERIPWVLLSAVQVLITEHKIVAHVIMLFVYEQFNPVSSDVVYSVHCIDPDFDSLPRKQDGILAVKSHRPKSLVGLNQSVKQAEVTNVLDDTALVEIGCSFATSKQGNEPTERKTKTPKRKAARMRNIETQKQFDAIPTDDNQSDCKVVTGRTLLKQTPSQTKLHISENYTKEPALMWKVYETWLYAKKRFQFANAMLLRRTNLDFTKAAVNYENLEPRFRLNVVPRIRHLFALLKQAGFKSPNDFRTCTNTLDLLELRDEFFQNLISYEVYSDRYSRGQRTRMPDWPGLMAKLSEFLRKFNGNSIEPWCLRCNKTNCKHFRGNSNKLEPDYFQTKCTDGSRARTYTYKIVSSEIYKLSELMLHVERSVQTEVNEYMWLTTAGTIKGKGGGVKKTRRIRPKSNSDTE